LYSTTVGEIERYRNENTKKDIKKKNEEKEMKKGRGRDTNHSITSHTEHC
jgi:hypothetical protein